MTREDASIACVPRFAATVSAADAETIRWHVVVVGAGPAGTSAAIRLARAGLRVLVVDRAELPRGKVCGCCLSAAAVAEIGLLGAAGAALDAGAAVPLERVRLASRGAATTIPLVGGMVASRERLDAALARAAAAAGARWLPAVRVREVIECGSPAADGVLRVRATAADGRGISLAADFVVIAAGIADHVRIAGAADDAARRPPRSVAARSRIGIGTTLPATAADMVPGELLMAVDRDGYCGVVRLEDGRIDVAAAVDPAATVRVRSPADLVRAILRAAGVDHLEACARAFAAARWRATPALTRTAPPVAGATGRILRAGDAAGYVEPFTGEGIGWAVAGGRLVAESLVDAAGRLRRPDEVAADYAAAHRRHFASRHARCRSVARGLRHPALVAGALAAARIAPWAARRLVPAVVGDARAVGAHR